MGFIEAAIFILFFAIISVPIANRIRWPLEIFLLIGSAIIGSLPGLPSVEINPRIVFNLFLPPILFYAAYFISWHEFKFNLRPISLLAFGLVIFTMAIVACMAKLLFTSFSWPECFLLGAIISPTDAASATSIIKKLGAPKRLVTILEGESLINDATALILFRFSLVAIFSNTFSWMEATTQFLIIGAGGVSVGLLMGLLAVFIVQKIHSATAETTFTFITSLTAYLLAEQIGASGVIATVVCGIYFGIRFPELSSSRTRIHSKASWDTLIFIINGFVFTLIGLELPLILASLPAEAIPNYILFGVIISFTVIVARIVWVFVIAHLSRLLFPAISHHDPTPSPKVLLILGWCGMRGIVSLAAALSIPYFIQPSIPFPQREVILLVTYCVIVITLILPAATLPILLQLFGLTDAEDKLKQEASARLKSLEGIIIDLQKIINKVPIPEAILKEFRNQIDRRVKVIQTQIDPTPYSTLNSEYQSLKRLTLAAIISERNTLIRLRKIGDINEDIFHVLMEELDLEELRAKTLRV